MLAVRALYHDGKLEWLEPPPEDAQGMVAVVFLEAEQVQDADKREADMLAASPNFRRLMELSICTRNRTTNLQQRCTTFAA